MKKFILPVNGLIPPLGNVAATIESILVLTSIEQL